MAAPRVTLNSVLSELGLSALIRTFQQEQVDEEIAVSLTDSKLARLGLETIGDRHRFRTKLKALGRETSADASVTNTHSNMQQVSNFRHERNILFGRNTSKKKITRNKKSGWTAQFYCLSNNLCEIIPSSAEKEIHTKAGLGLKKIRLENHDNECMVMEKIMSEKINEQNETVGFPQLKDCGGVELMRTGQNCRNLKIIGCKWNSSELKTCIGSQARMYIRPVQKSLSTKPIINAVSMEEEMTNECESCKKEFPIRELRHHILCCTNITSDNNVEITPSTVITDLSFISNSTLTGDLQETYISADDFQSLGTDILPSNHGTDIIQAIIEDELTIDTDMTIIQPTAHSSNFSVNEIVVYCKENNVTNPVEILKKCQQNLVKGRPLEIKDINEPISGETNFIIVDRENLLHTSFEELSDKTREELGATLEVQFYTEAAEDYGGPRKEFFRLVLKPSRKSILTMDYENSCKMIIEWLALFLTSSENIVTKGEIDDIEQNRKSYLNPALTILQNGKLPTFMNENVLEELWNSVNPSSCIKQLRIGLDTLGIFELMTQLPSLQFLFHPTPVTLTLKRLMIILKPVFSENGSNRLTLEKEVYAMFVKYVREVASGRRGSVSLGHILQFATGTDEEPMLGFTIHPSIEFVEVQANSSFIPTANTCINCLKLPRSSLQVKLPADPELFSYYDYEFILWPYLIKTTDRQCGVCKKTFHLHYEVAVTPIGIGGQSANSSGF